MPELYDVIIIGAGCAGFGAAMYCGRFDFKTLVLGDILGGTIITTDVVENYPGFKKLTGQELADKLMEHALDYKSVELKNEKAVDVEKENDLFRITTDENNIYHAKTLIFTTGTKFRKLGVPGEDTFANKGVHYCVLCDAYAYKGKTGIVVGGSDSAAKEALLFTQWAKKVYIVYRGEKIRPEPINYDRVMERVKEGKIEIINNTNIIEIKGDQKVTHVIFDKPYNGKKEFFIDAVFVEIGHIPLSDLASKLGVKLNEKGEIIINRASETNVPGVFAAGDVVDTIFKQAITGVGEAVSAAYSAYQHIKANEKIYPTTAEEYEKHHKTLEEEEVKRIAEHIRKG